MIFTSDNGPWLPFGAHGGSAGPLANGKGTTWEGGVRAPTIFWWPGTVKPGVVTDIGTSMDVFVTAAKLTGTGPSARQLQFHYWDDELRAIRKGRYDARPRRTGAAWSRARRCSTRLPRCADAGHGRRTSTPVGGAVPNP